MENQLQELALAAQKMGWNLSTGQLTQFDLYQQELLRWNAKINLISAKSAREIVGRHFQDSLTALHFIEKKDARLIDIGCGAGFPGIPLKIALPSLKLYLVEINRKKVSFLKHILRLLNLTDAFVLANRVEILQQAENWQFFFDIMISRAAFKLPEMLSYGTYFLVPGGTLIALKGSDIKCEFSPQNSTAFPYNYYQLFQYNTIQSSSGSPRKIIVGKKTK